VCSPSRNSFMSGRRNDKTKVWNFKNTFREVGPNWTTLPSHFLHHGYFTLGGRP
jgi:iduronate 2-sulfatase